jgi:hypothetical protein
VTLRIDLNIGRPSIGEYRLSGRNLEGALVHLDMRHRCWGEYRDNSSYESPGDANGRLTSVTVTANPTIELPSWSGYGQAATAEQQEWDRMLAALTQHEQEHHNVYLRVARNFRTMLRRMRGLDQDRMQTEFQDFLGRVRDEQRAYDGRTRNGQNQGVQLVVPSAQPAAGSPGQAPAAAPTRASGGGRRGRR